MKPLSIPLSSSNSTDSSGSDKAVVTSETVKNDSTKQSVNEASGLHDAGKIHSHVHSEDSLRKIVNRLSRVEGQIRGVKTMVQENRPCPEVLIQIAAVRGGLDRLARVILDEHLNECITRAVDEGNIEAEVSALKAVLDRFIV